MYELETTASPAHDAAFHKLTGPNLDLCSLGWRAFSGVVRECQLIAANFLSGAAITAAVVNKVHHHREHISTLPGGASWLGYIELLGKQDLKAPPEERRPVPVIAEVKQALSCMRGHIQTFGKDLMNPTLPNPRNLQPIQLEIVGQLEARISQAIARSTIERSELMRLSRLFSVAATQQLYLRCDRSRNISVFGENAEQVIAKNEISEGYIDEFYGRCALPLPFFDHLSFSSFRKIEGTGIIPLGLTVQVQHVDGTPLEPARFFAHDDDHFFNRMRETNNARTIGINLSGHAPVDMALYQGIDSALAFSEVLTRLIDTLPDKRSKTIAEAIIFYILREERDVYGILDFNAPQIKRQVISIARQSAKADTATSYNQFWALHHRLGDSKDLGQAFRTKPSPQEIFQRLKWLAQTL
jgi:hypothetical protein